VGDCDGVVVIPKEDAPAVLERSKAKKARETEIRAKLQQGITTAELFHLTPKFR
jgi:4-hydroxy-4-methyl-2-oxoglutarate aldolase